MKTESEVHDRSAPENQEKVGAWVHPSLRMTEGLTFDDILVMPCKSKVLPKNTSTKTTLCPGIDLFAPFVSSPMDRVTETQMTIAMGLFGGIGIFHRAMGNDRLIQAVRDVKRYMAGKILDPVTVHPAQDLASVRSMNSPYTGFPVVQGEGGKDKLVGILTRRDMDGQPKDRQVSDVMTSKEKLVVAHQDISLDDALNLVRKNKIEKLPLVDENDFLVGLVTRRDLDLRKNNPNATVDQEGRLRVGVAVGTKDYEVMVELVRDLIAVGVDLVCLVSAHGGHIQIVDALRLLKKTFPNLPVIAGNVADKESALELLRAGADALRSGFGSGSICTTRIVSGCGVPQVTAIIECREAVEEFKIESGKHVPIISDGGASEPGHSTKALAAGASAMMFGNLLAGTEEAPGDKITTPKGVFKEYRGMGSNAAMKEHGGDQYFKEGSGKLLAEGVTGRVRFKGKVRKQLEKLLGGLKEGMGYNGASTIPILWRARLVRVTNAGLRESYPHHLADIEGQESFEEE